jgi:hypothetical protein
MFVRNDKCRMVFNDVALCSMNTIACFKIDKESNNFVSSMYPLFYKEHINI